MNHKTTRRILLGLGLAALVVSTGCLEGTAHRTGAYLPAKPQYAPIDVFYDAEPPVAWAEVGLVAGKGTGVNAYGDDVIAVVKDQARSLGADAVIITEDWIEEDIRYDSHGYAHVYERRILKGIAIVYL